MLWGTIQVYKTYLFYRFKITHITVSIDVFVSCWKV